MKDILVWDTETTGLLMHPSVELHKQPKIIEFGAARLSCKDGSLLGTTSIMINPSVPLEAIIVKITGITDDQLVGAKTFAEALPEIRAVFAQCQLMFAHNIPFDRGMLANELKRVNVTDFPWPEKALCTVGLFKEVWGRNPKMTELYEHVMGKPLAQTHRALDDVMALVEIVQKEELWRLA